MTNKILKIAVGCALAAGLLSSCSDKGAAPVIDSIWVNMYSEPARPVTYAYPGQVLCIHGSNFTGLTGITINSVEANISGSLIYDNDNYITFTVPAAVHISEDYREAYLTLRTNDGEVTYEPFIIKPTSEKPSISGFTSTVLVAGSEMTISGKNLDGVTEVTLPGTFDSRIKCELSETGVQSSTRVTIVIPEGATFAKGRAEITMAKTEYVTNRAGNNYTESVYSSVTNFSN